MKTKIIIIDQIIEQVIYFDYLKFDIGCDKKCDVYLVR